MNTFVAIRTSARHALQRDKHKHPVGHARNRLNAPVYKPKQAQLGLVLAL